MATIANVKTRTGAMLGQTALGQALYEPLTTRVTAAYDEVTARLKDEGLLVWNSSSGTVPNAVANHLVALMALECTEDVAVSDERYLRIVNRATIGLSEIRKFLRESTSALDEPEDF